MPSLTGHLIDATGRPAPDLKPSTAPAGTADAILDTGSFDDVVFDDVDGEAHRAYGYRAPTVLLVRPDGYVAVRTPATRVDVIADAVRRWAAHTPPAYAPTTKPANSDAQPPTETANAVLKNQRSKNPDRNDQLL